MLEIQKRSLTLEEFLQLPETKPASEYIDGEIVQKLMPQGKHSRLQGKLVTTINLALEIPKIALAFPELRCTFGGRSIVPDVVVLAWQRIPIDPQGNIANVFETYPDWIIEILSPEQNPTKVINKILHSLQYGTSMGWLIDPEVKSVLVFPNQAQPQFFENSEEVLPVPELVSPVRLTVGEIFGWLKL